MTVASSTSQSMRSRPCGNTNRIAVADNHAVGRLEEHVRHAAVRPACRHRFRLRFRAAAAFADVAEEIHRGVENLARVLNRREDPDLRHVVDVARTRARRQPLVRRDVIGDFVEPELQPVFVLADQIQHGVGHRHPRIYRIALELPVCGLDLDDHLVLQHHADLLFAFDLERSQLEGLAARRPRADLAGQRNTGCDRQHHEHAELHDQSSHRVTPWGANVIQESQAVKV